jgi:hypothetical protein
MRATVLLTSLLVLAGAACDKSSSTKTEPSAAPSQAPPSVVNAKLGCIAIKEGGWVIPSTLGPGDLTLAASRGKELLVNATHGKAERTILGQGGKPEGAAEVVTSPHTAAPSAADAGAGAGAGSGSAEALTWASASLFEGSLATVALGATRAGDAGCGGATMGVDLAFPPAATRADAGLGETPHPSAVQGCKLAAGFAGAAAGDRAVSVTTTTSPAGIDALLYEAGKTRTVHVDAIAKDGVIASPAAAVGDTWVAVAWTASTAGSAPELRLSRIEKDGTKAEKFFLLDKGVVGAPAIAFEHDMLHVVWASRAGDRHPVVLRWTKWAGKGNPTEPQILATGGTSPSHPAIALQPNGRFLVAWMEGDDKSGVVKAGASRVNILHAVTNADVVSNPGTNARDPAVALDGPTPFVVWNEATPKTHEIRATTLRCIE